MNLSKLIHEVWNDDRTRDMRLRKDEVKTLVEVLIDHIIAGLLEYGKVKMQGLFTLKVKKAKGRRIAHPINKKLMYIDDYFKVGIEPSRRLKHELKDYNIKG